MEIKTGITGVDGGDWVSPSPVSEPDEKCAPETGKNRIVTV